MAFITVLARRKEVGKFQLKGPTSVGRSMDCDIYIPDVFVSRVHCRFVQQDGNWHVMDAESHNGVWCMGRRLSNYLLKPGDVIEIGTIAVRYNAGDSDRPSHPAPLGMGLGVTELMDTVYAHDMRPSQYVKLQKVRTAQWRERVKSRLAEPIEQEFEPVIDTEPWKREEWAELDMELQIAAGQELMMDWEPPIFNPKRQALAAQGEASSATAGTAVAARPGTQAMDSIDEEVEFRLTEYNATRKAAAQPVVKNDYEGIEFVSYTWRDRLRDETKERLAIMWTFAKRNPQIAAAIVIGLVLVFGAMYKYGPERKKSHIWVPETPEDIAIYGKVAKSAK